MHQIMIWAAWRWSLIGAKLSQLRNFKTKAVGKAFPEFS
jgi:hypothetical protein